MELNVKIVLCSKTSRKRYGIPITVEWMLKKHADQILNAIDRYPNRKLVCRSQDGYDSLIMSGITALLINGLKERGKHNCYEVQTNDAGHIVIMPKA